ncbi:MAG: hypothetical protein CTY12_00775 [Methylotenera sp.]|nr:MAG: hypothetical protein CTY12_00775 [Methylotenera sp.]
MVLKSRTVRATLFKKDMKRGWKKIWKGKGRINNLRREPLDGIEMYHHKIQQTKFTTVDI